ncbi:MAG: hypothetical protein WCA61_07655 [Nitrososphaeraceae archaeon]
MKFAVFYGLTICIRHNDLDTIPFAGSSMSLHNRAGQNFTVSYTVAGNLVYVTGVPK